MNSKVANVNEVFVESTILPRDPPLFVEKLNEWAGCESNQKWRLLYKGSRDGFQAKPFHDKCDNQGATYTIVKSRNNTFGGYNPVSWTSQRGYSNGKHKFFIFTISKVFPHVMHNKRVVQIAILQLNYLSISSV